MILELQQLIIIWELLWTGRIYRAKISEGNEIIADLIPVMRNSDSKVGMRDTVTGQFFTNAGTGEFIAGGIL